MAHVPKPKHDKIYTATLEWLIGDSLPFSTLDSDPFQNMVKECISNIDPPCSSTIRGLLVGHRNRLTERLKDLFDRTLVYGAITVDSWTSKSNKSYLGITLRWLDENFQSYECALDMAPLLECHTAANTARKIRKYYDTSADASSLGKSPILFHLHVVHIIFKRASSRS
jgi:hypothetical protein